LPRSAALATKLPQFSEVIAEDGKELLKEIVNEIRFRFGAISNEPRAECVIYEV
jgi:hypothetical protein